ncbi:MAG: ABC transporter substrate-binding protein, partial [Syntrophomonadaceae bacterium]|nr:ABC transporter substrate-binding protein [Syntrophomonadaceae bacterium]
MFILSFITGCGSQTVEAPPANERTVVDMAGRTVTLPVEINSIGTFGSIGVLNTFVELMGEGDKICNEMSPRFTKTDKWNYQYKFAPQIKGSPVFQDANDEISMEVVLKIKPDICLTMNKETIELLEKQGLSVIYLNWNKDEDVKQCITLLGEVLNKQEVANDYIKYFDDMVAKAEELTKNLKVEDKKKVLYGNITEFNQPHLIAEWWIPKAGGISVTDNGRTTNKLDYTTEDILQWNPDVMVIATASTKSDLLADPKIAGVTAVKDNVIYATPTVAHTWGNRTPEQPLTIMWMMHKLYPEIKSQKDLAEDIRYFYSHFFKYEMSDEEIAKIIG